MNKSHGMNIIVLKGEVKCTYTQGATTLIIGSCLPRRASYWTNTLYQLYSSFLNAFILEIYIIY